MRYIVDLHRLQNATYWTKTYSAPYAWPLGYITTLSRTTKIAIPKRYSYWRDYVMSYLATSVPTIRHVYMYIWSIYEYIYEEVLPLGILPSLALKTNRKKKRKKNFKKSLPASGPDADSGRSIPRGRRPSFSIRRWGDPEGRSRRLRCLGTFDGVPFGRAKRLKNFVSVKKFFSRFSAFLFKI